MHTERNVILVSIAVVAVLLTALMWKPSRVGTVTGEPLVFYCAAGMQPPVKATAEKYEEEYGIPIQIQYGGSGTLLSSIRVAKQGDLYLAADESYIDIAREQGLLAEALPLAYIRPVIIVQKGNPKNIRSIRDLPREDVTIALGNPDAASIGKTTKRLLEAAGQWQRVERATRVFKPTVGTSSTMSNSAPWTPESSGTPLPNSSPIWESSPIPRSIQPKNGSRSEYSTRVNSRRRRFVSHATWPLATGA